MDRQYGPTHAVMLYDRASGTIHYTLLHTTLAHSPAPDWPEMEAELRALAKQQDPASENLEILHSENHNPEHAYKLDTVRRILVKLPAGPQLRTILSGE